MKTLITVSLLWGLAAATLVVVSRLVGYGHRPCNVSGSSRRRVFEAWARGYGLDLTRSKAVAGQYEARETAMAWEAFNLGVNAPREIRI